MIQKHFLPRFPPEQVLDVRRLRYQLPERSQQLRHHGRGHLVGQQWHLGGRRAAQVIRGEEAGMSKGRQGLGAG